LLAAETACFTFSSSEELSSDELSSEEVSDSEEYPSPLTAESLLEEEIIEAVIAGRAGRGMLVILGFLTGD
jgi:predicted Fe-Mo cluster-binding NifX family protein